MTQAYNLSQLANNLNSSGQLDATDGLVNAVPVANGGTGATTGSAARTNLGAAASGANTDITSLSAPALGAATATTQATNDNTNKVATTAFVAGQAGTATPIAAGTAAVGTSLLYSRQDHVHPVVGVGYGQSWSNVTGSRSAGTTYTNSTSSPIQLSITPSVANGVNGSGSITVGGVVAATFACFVSATTPPVSSMSVIVPAGATYLLTLTGATIGNWSELR